MTAANTPALTPSSSPRCGIAATKAVYVLSGTEQSIRTSLGVKDVRFLPGHRDGWLEPSWELQRQIVEVIRDVRPQRVLIQSPERRYNQIQGSHPDHLAAGEAAIRAIYPAAENRYAWPELISEQHLEPWHVSEVWIMSHPEMTHAVDITLSNIGFY